MGKCELTILNDGMPEATEALFRGLLGLKRVTFHCWEPQWIYEAFQELSMRRGKRLRE